MTHNDPNAIDHPPCPKCGAPTWLTRVVMAPEGIEHCFECAVCDISERAVTPRVGLVDAVNPGSGPQDPS